MAYKAIFRRNVVIMRLIYINRAWAGFYQAILHVIRLLSPVAPLQASALMPRTVAAFFPCAQLLRAFDPFHRLSK